MIVKIKIFILLVISIVSLVAAQYPGRDEQPVGHCASLTIDCFKERKFIVVDYHLKY